MTPGQIILLNGSASADKATLLQALQAVLDVPYLNLSLAQLLADLPVLLVGVRCSLDSLVAHNRWTLDQARAHVAAVGSMTWK